MRALLLRLAGFSGAPIIAAIVPFFVLPFVSRATGADGWADFSSGQSIGILGVVAIQFGWGVIGPVRVAQNTDAAARAGILRDSLWSRGVLSIVVLPVVAVATVVVTGPELNLDAVLIAVASALGGFTPAWYCIGAGRPDLLMLYDAVPKMIAAGIAIPVILLTDSITLYPALLAVATVVGVVLHARGAMRGQRLERTGWPGIRRTIRDLVPIAGIDAVGNVYGSTPVPIATVGLPSAEASSYASADKVYRMGILAVVAFGNAFQAWVLDPGTVSRRTRHLAALGAHIVLGLVGGACIALLGPWATALVFGADVGAALGPCILYGIAFLCISTSTPFIRNALVPSGRYRAVLLATTSAAVLGLVLMAAGAAAGSQVVIATGAAASEIITLAVLAAPALRIILRSDLDRTDAQASA